MVSGGLVLPLAVLSGSGHLLGALLMNSKGYQKSLEQGELWVVHPSTGKLLPLDGVSFSLLREKESSWYQAILNPGMDELFLEKKSAMEGINPQYQQTLSVGEGAGVQGTLDKLSAVIHQRRIDKPEGSYTTHLFAKGEDKIRKKTGEEAIELLLAQSQEDVIYEAADLIYHMMVLLEVKDIPIRDVLTELENRMK